MERHERAKHFETRSMTDEQLLDRLVELLAKQPPHRLRAFQRYLEREMSKQKKKRPRKPKARRRTLADQLKAAATKSGLSVSELARRTGVEQSNLHRFMTGDRDLKLANAEKIAAYFRMELTAPTMPED